MTNRRWNYVGDVSIREGGYYWREDNAEDYVLCVEVIPCSIAGGPDNLFWVHDGLIYLGDAERQDKALDCIGLTHETANRATIVDACMNYQGMEHDADYIVQIGKGEAGRYYPGFDMPSADDIVQLRANASLRRYIRMEHLGLSR